MPGRKEESCQNRCPIPCLHSRGQSSAQTLSGFPKWNPRFKRRGRAGKAGGRDRFRSLISRDRWPAVLQQTGISSTFRKRASQKTHVSILTSRRRTEIVPFEKKGSCWGNRKIPIRVPISPEMARGWKGPERLFPGSPRSPAPGKQGISLTSPPSPALELKNVPSAFELLRRKGPVR